MFLTLLLNLESQPYAESMPDLPESHLGWLFIKVLLAMILVLALAFMAIKYLLPGSPWIKKFQNSPIKVIAQTLLENRKSLYLIEVAGKVVLVGTSDQSIAALAQFEKEAFDTQLKNSSSKENHAEKK